MPDLNLSLLGAGVTAEALLGILQALGRVVIIIVAAVVAKRMTRALVDRYFLKRLDERRVYFEEKRARTLAILVKSVVTYVIDFIVILSILSVFNVPIESVLAAAGIVGLAVGFGAQNLVRDVITGFFIVFEDQFAVGEHVKVNGKEGVVEEMGLRVTKIRSFSGELHIIPNGVISEVTNLSRGPIRVMFEVEVAYEEDIDHVLSVLKEITERAAAEMDAFQEGPKVLGVNTLGASGVSVLIWGRTTPGEQWAAGRELKRRIKVGLDEAGIEIPYPRQVIVPPEVTKIRAPFGFKTRPADDEGGKD